MSIVIPAFETRVLTGVINKRPRVHRLFESLFFRRRTPVAAKHLDVEILVHGRRLLPFVGPADAGVYVAKVGREVQSVQAPRLRPKQKFTAPELLDFTQPGEGLQMAATATDRDIEKTVAENLDLLRDNSDVTAEWMCSKAVCGGILTVDQENIAFTIDYRMPETHKVVLGSGSKWTDDGVDPVDDLEGWGDLILDSCGLSPDVVVMGTNASKAFRKSDRVKDELDTRRVEGASWKTAIGEYYRGNIGGQDIYRYGGSVPDAGGSTQYLMDPDYILMGCTSVNGRIDYGLPEDLEAGGRRMEIFTKARVNWDPSFLELLAETRPLPQPLQPDAFVYAKVV